MLSQEGASSDTRSTYSPRASNNRYTTKGETYRSKKLAQGNAQTIKNRIAYFAREEAKIWRDLEDVRRQTGKIEDGRARKSEKDQANQSLLRRSQQLYYENRLNAARKKKDRDVIRDIHEKALIEKRANGEERRQKAQEVLQQKRLFLRETELRNSERAMTIQRSSIDARMRNNEIRQRRLEELHEEAEIRRAAAVKEVDDIESLLPNLEAQEMECLQRLQNSRVVTANVLEELEASLGQSSSVTNQLRLRGKSSMRNSFLPPGTLFDVNDGIA